MKVDNCHFHKVEPCVYEYGGTGYRVERMANGLWDAYLPGGHGLSFRLWESIRHKTRKAAASAISARFRDLRKTASITSAERSGASHG